MAIRASASSQIDLLIRNLSANAVAREAAVARLTLIGSRAVERLLALAADDTASADARAAAWRALEAIGDSRTLDPALGTVATPTTPATVAVAAIGAAGAFITGDRGARVVDRFAPIALDRTRPDIVRLAALRALRDLDRKTIAPVLASLADDPSASVREEAAQGRKSRDVKRRAAAAAAAPADRGALLTASAERGLPDDPHALRAALQAAAAAVSLAVLLRILERVREHEEREPPERRSDWTLARAAAHQALADRGSRLALYDLRESLQRATAGGLPVEFLAPLAAIGDASCLEAIAAAHATSTDTWWRQHLADAFYTIVAREKLTRRHAVMKKIAKKWPDWAAATRPST